MAGEAKTKRSTILGTLGVLVNLGLARIAPHSSVERLVDTLESDNEDTSTAAYMALVKLGPNYARTVLESCGDATPSPTVVQLLGHMGNTDLITDLEALAAAAE